MKFLKNFNLPLVAVVFLVSIVAVLVFTWSYTKSDDGVPAATKRLEKKALPAGILSQINEENFFLVYLSSGCASCSEELDLLTELDANGLKIFGIMAENESVIKNYINDKKIKFPVIRDRNLEMLRGLKIEFFPTNLKIENGIIKRAYLGPPENKEKLLALISD